jgi:hypothetical protein
MYPIAWAYVEHETYDSWYWFLGLLQKDLEISNGGEGWVLISDQQKCLLKAVSELVPRADNRMCARHIYANWRKKYGGQVRSCKGNSGDVLNHQVKSFSTITEQS